jgi:protease I
MGNELQGLRVAILVTDGFEQVEMTAPRDALEAAGAMTRLISPKQGEVQGWNHQEKADKFPVDTTIGADNSFGSRDFDALLLPGGVANPDQLRTNPHAVSFVKDFVKSHKPIAAICHGPWMLVEAGAVKGRRVTSWPSLKTDINNAGGRWVDSEVVVDGPLVTSRKPDDLPAFNRSMIEQFKKSFADSKLHSETVNL